MVECAGELLHDSARTSEPQLLALRADLGGSAPSRPIDRGIPGPGLLAHVLTSKYADHSPLYRQSEIYARQDVELERRHWQTGSAARVSWLLRRLNHYGGHPLTPVARVGTAHSGQHGNHRL
jgi:hypothetical protein